ncbi:DUF4956 domain-containing protein [Candidatus Pelagibacter sp. Uisw_130]|jgi:hypothetical protein|uniref:DUF4956 domain-containing protein n=1 Tax=Candidatus Pelagibacter sp. Uisw_130 TaxID=3230989 RepID=UPI0039E756AB|tara:strand:+ start:119 stop:811 length:693 start_codon:yes stop_codon:yes gene_type:complete
MEKKDLNFFLNQNVQIELSNFILSLFCAAVLSFIVHLFYIRFSSTLSNRIEFSKNFVVLGVATCIVIMIVKSSLALSLGLVGALSIVRFRAAIKEPEELVYLFLIIAVGLGCGANQLIVTTIGIFFALLTIIIYSKYLNNKKDTSTEIINMGIIIEENISDTQINNLIKDANKISLESKFISMSRSESNTTVNLDIRPTTFEELTKLTGVIKKEYKNSKVILSNNSDLSL